MQPRVYGPYPHRSGWSVVTLDAAGKRKAQVCRGFEEAIDLVRGLDEDLPADPTVRMATVLERYSAFMAYKGNKPETITTTKYRLYSFFAEVIWQPLRVLDRDTCQRLYDKQVSTTAVDTHRNTLDQAKTFLRWCVRNHYLSRSPMDRVRPVGKRRHGKPQLRVDEARAWLRVANSMAAVGNPGAIAAMMALLMGMRSSEVLRCCARDVDDSGALLWIPVSKTRAGKRFLAIPAPLRRHLLHLVRTLAPQERLFPHRREWLYDWVRKICARARTPLVCTHSMRGLHATLAIGEGITPPAVAKALGHASVRATLLSYADPNAVAQADQGRCIARLRRKVR